MPLTVVVGAYPAHSIILIIDALNHILAVFGIQAAVKVDGYKLLVFAPA